MGLLIIKFVGISKLLEGETKQQLTNAFSEALNDDSIGILVTNDKCISKLDNQMRRMVENSLSPVVVTLTASSGAQENLRELIKKAIGIDLWSK